jgi:hypothetical protein
MPAARQLVAEAHRLGADLKGIGGHYDRCALHADRIREGLRGNWSLESRRYLENAYDIAANTGD